jgi:hypothetical protein
VAQGPEIFKFLELTEVRNVNPFWILLENVQPAFRNLMHSPFGGFQKARFLHVSARPVDPIIEQALHAARKHKTALVFSEPELIRK